MGVMQASKRLRGWEQGVPPVSRGAPGEQRAPGGGDDGTPGLSWAAARRDNARSRDFTVNAIMFDPFGALLHDPTGGVRDCGRRLLRSIGDPGASFAADPARVLRAVRHSARCGAARRPPAPLSTAHHSTRSDTIAPLGHGECTGSV